MSMQPTGEKFETWRAEESARRLTFALGMVLAFVGVLWLTGYHRLTGQSPASGLPVAVAVARDGTLVAPLVVAAAVVAMRLKGAAGPLVAALAAALVVAASQLEVSSGTSWSALTHDLALDTFLVFIVCLPAAMLLCTRAPRPRVADAAVLEATPPPLVAARPAGASSPVRRPGLPRRILICASTVVLGAAALSTGATATASTPAETADPGPACGRNLHADVVALDQTIWYNRLGAHDPHGMIFALKRDVVSSDGGGALTPGAVQLRSDKRPRPLTLRMNVGDCLTINFENLLSKQPQGDQPSTRHAGISVLGLQLKNTILDDGTNVGKNATEAKPTAGLVAPGETATYTFYAEREGAYELYSPGDNVSVEGLGTLAHGLFGSVNVEPTGAEWYRSQLTRSDMDKATVSTTKDGHPVIDYDATYLDDTRYPDGTPILNILDTATMEIVHSDLSAVITGPGRGSFKGSQPDGGWYPPNPTYPNRNEPFREFTAIFHDEAAVVQAFPEVFADPAMEFTLDGVRDGKAINYGTGGIASEVLANRLGVGPARDCVDCKLEEFFLTSWALGDPAQVVDIPADKGCGTTCEGAQGPKATKVLYPDDPSNVYHSYVNDHVKFRNIQVGKEHHIFHLHAHQWLQTPDDDNSTYLDSQATGPGSSYTYEIAYGGGGNRNKTPGDAIFHCHFYPHFAQGMWALWRNHDVFQRGTKLDDEGRPVTGSSGALPDGEIERGTPTPAVVPLPTLAMAPMPGVDAAIVDGQVDLAGEVSETDPDGIADYLQGWKAPKANPGFPFYIPGVAGHRPPTPALDMTDPDKSGYKTTEMDGGLPRHVVTGGHDDPAQTKLTPLDFSKVLDTMTATFPAEEGTEAEQQAMKFHATPRHDTSLPDGTPAGTGEAIKGYETNGLDPAPGAPFAEPCRNDDGSANTDAPLRTYRAAAVQLDMKLNKLGWHFPQARMLALWGDVGSTLAGKRAPEPFVMRANSGDCLNYYHTNLIPGNYEQDAFQVRTPTDVIGQHIHLVKFDVTSSDGSANGYNYEDGTFSPDEVRERIAALRKENGCEPQAVSADRTTCPVAQAHPFFGPGPGGRWLGARTTMQRWWADPVLNNDGKDRTLGNVYTHDHFGPSTHQQTGLYATLIIEPNKSLWRHPENGDCFGDPALTRRYIPPVMDGGCVPKARFDGGPTSWRADVLTGNVPSNYDQKSFREFYFEFSDFQHAYAADKGATWTTHKVKIGGTNYQVKDMTAANPDPLHAVNPPGAIQNQAVTDTSPWLKVKPTLHNQPDKCPSGDSLFTDAGCPETIATADVGTFSINYRNEPVAARVLDPTTMSQAAGEAGDLSLAFSSNVVRKDGRLNQQPNDTYRPLTADVKPGDPYTPMMRTYEGDNVRIKVQVGATEEGHNASLWGAKWLQEFASPDSGWRNSQMLGISEQFNWDVTTAVDPAQKGKGADYLFSPDNSVDGMWNGMWSLLRGYGTYRAKKNQSYGTDLLPLPENRIDMEKGLVNSVENLDDFDSKSKYQCPVDAPRRTFEVTAALARDILPDGAVTYNSRGARLEDPTAIMYVRSSDLDADGKLKPGVPVEPLILRTNAGDCMNLRLTNKLPTEPLPDLNGYNMLPPIMDRYTANAPAEAPSDSFNFNDMHPSNRVGLRPQLISYDPTRGAGNSVGTNGDKTVAPGDTSEYWWYAGDLTYDAETDTMKATPVEFGATNLISSDPLKHSNKGAIGALVVEPQGATWEEDADSRAQATVTYDGGTFRDFVLLFQDDLNLRFGDGSAVPFITGEDDAEDTGMNALNYRTEPLWYRLGLDPAATQETIAAADFSRVLANSAVGGDPETPVFTAAPGEKIRLRVLQPNGHARNHVFALHGHVWQRNPYTSGCETTPCLGSTSLGDNPASQWVGSQEGHGPTDHWDIVPRHGAGGAWQVEGDYLYRDMAAFSFYNGVWGLLRVKP